MKRGFTLIEILVAVTIVVLVSGGALLYLNNFRERQNLDQQRDEIMLMLKLAQSYAKTRQLPINSTESDLGYVQVQVSNGVLIVGANGIGSTYSSRVVNDDQRFSLTLNPSVLYFWSGTGNLVHDVTGTGYGVGETASADIKIQGVFSGTNRVKIDSLGQVTTVDYVEN